MQWLLNLSTRAKLMAAFGLMLLLLLVAMTIAYRDIDDLQSAQRDLYAEQFASAVGLRAVRSNQNGINADVLALLLVTDPTEHARLEQDIADRLAENDATLTTLLAAAQGDTALTSRLQEFATLRAGFRQTLNEDVLPAIRAGQTAEAQGLILGIQTDRDSQMRTIADELVDQADEQAQITVRQAEERATRALQIFGLVGFVALLLTIGLALLLTRAIASPLSTFSAAATRIAGGDLTVDLGVNSRRDEVGAMTHSFSQMVTTLRNVNREVQDGVNVLASSSSEILAATTQVASGAAETATAVSETTTTVEEVKQTAQVTLQKARLVADGAQRSAQISQAGKKAVEDTIQGMQRIRTQMEQIAGSIVQLSEQGQAIGEIIATVNDLAEQSNLLAVNAAIEAAKAGDQGKGFAVVAQEVKSLATQSKQATAQVRTILGDIQKATSAAVLATEQGSKAVEAGVRQSADANEAIRQLADSLAEATQAATQIAASSQQQSVGMDQVALAMENIKVASTQNVAGTRQAEVAAQNLHDLGLSLKATVTRFKV